jgi:hypothetical protein
MVKLKLIQPLGLLVSKCGFTEAIFSLTSVVKRPKPRVKFLHRPQWHHAKSKVNAVVIAASVVSVSQVREGNNVSHAVREGNNVSRVKPMVVPKRVATEGRAPHVSRVGSNRVREGHVRHVRRESHVVRVGNSVRHVRHESRGL